MAKPVDMTARPFEPNPNAYVKHRMDPGDGERFETWVADGGDARATELLAGLFDAGLELHVMVRQGGWVAQLKDAARESGGLPFLLTGWAGDGVTALLLVMWKHYSEADGDWTVLMVESDRGGKYR